MPKLRHYSHRLLALLRSKNCCNRRWIADRSLVIPLVDVLRTQHFALRASVSGAKVSFLTRSPIRSHSVKRECRKILIISAKFFCKKLGAPACRNPKGRCIGKVKKRGAILESGKTPGCWKLRGCVDTLSSPWSHPNNHRNSISCTLYSWASILPFGAQCYHYRRPPLPAPVCFSLGRFLSPSPTIL